MAWGARSSNFVEWYSNKSFMILDKMCCCSYVDAQVCGEVPVDDYYKKRSTTIPTEWIDDPLSPFGMTNGGGKHKFIQYDTLDLHSSSCKLSPSFGTTTTVTMQTQQSYDDSDSRSVSSCETARAANRSTETRRFDVSEAPSSDLDSSFDSSFDLVGVAPRSIEFNSPTSMRGDTPVASEDFAGGYKKHSTRKMKTRYCEKVVLCRVRTPEGLGRLPEMITVSEGQRLQMLIS
jgi:hypothetical protein